MRGRTAALAIAVAMLLGSVSGRAQQQPIYGCGTAISCRPLGFSTNGPSGTGGVGFGVGLSFEPGFQVRIVAPPTPTPTPEKLRIFHRGISLLPPTSAPTPTPTPPPPPPTTPSSVSPRR